MPSRDGYRSACHQYEFIAVRFRRFVRTCVVGWLLADATSPVIAGERFRLFKRPKPAATSSATVNPARVAPGQVTPASAQADEALPGSRIPTAETTMPGAVGFEDILPSQDLARFPRKSMTDAVVDDVPHIDLTADQAVSQIDLPAALRLGGWNSPEVLLAQQRVLAVTARQQFAAAQVLPSLNLGTNYDQHTGALQRANGQILQVQRSSLYLGGGANAVAAGTVNLPGLTYNLNIGESYFAYMVSKQQSERARAAAAAVCNNTLLLITASYCDLVNRQGTRAIAIRARDDAAEVARITATFAKSGQGREADAERARTELDQRISEVLQAEAAIQEASARLVEILNLESSMRLQSNENWIVPRSVVPDLIPLPELIAIGLYHRPEVAARRAEFHAAMLELSGARLLLFSPQFIAGVSGGLFGGGSDVNSTASRFGEFNGRNDQDLILYWSIRNLGLANKALIKTATARLAIADWEQTGQFNTVRAEIAEAYAVTQARSAQLDVRVRAISASEKGFQEDLTRARNGEGLPIEVLDSLRLRAKAQQEYLDTITDYNKAQYRLYVAIGQPPADLLIHTNPPVEPPSPTPAENAKE